MERQSLAQKMQQAKLKNKKEAQMTAKMNKLRMAADDDVFAGVQDEVAAQLAALNADKAKRK